jgi:hypothetical protein
MPIVVTGGALVDGPSADEMQSRLYIPEAPPEPTPVLLFLHGRGEAAERAPLDEAPGIHGPLWYCSQGNPLGFVVVWPQLRSVDDRWHDAETLRRALAIVRAVCDERRLERRIGVTGFSIGGLGCFALARHLASGADDDIRAAALVPVDAYNPPPPAARGRGTSSSRCGRARGLRRRGRLRVASRPRPGTVGAPVTVRGETLTTQVVVGRLDPYGQ